MAHQCNLVLIKWLCISGLVRRGVKWMRLCCSVFFEYLSLGNRGDALVVVKRGIARRLGRLNQMIVHQWSWRKECQVNGAQLLRILWICLSRQLGRCSHPLKTGFAYRLTPHKAIGRGVGMLWHSYHTMLIGEFHSHRLGSLVVGGVRRRLALRASWSLRSLTFI